MSSVAAPPTTPTEDPAARVLSAIEELADHLAAVRHAMDLLAASLVPRPAEASGPSPTPPPAPPVDAVPAAGAGAAVGPVADDAYDAVPGVLMAHLRRPAGGVARA